MACRTGCIIKDCESYAACLKTGAPRVLYANSAKGFDYSTEKAWNRDLDAYKQARSEGLQPASTKREAVEAARRISDATGTAFKADV